MPGKPWLRRLPPTLVIESRMHAPRFAITLNEDRPMPNQIFVIQPYWHAGTWVFDDPSRDLDKEPFVAGIPEIITDLVEDIPDARQGFCLTFSAAPFPGAQVEMELVREESGGHWYRVTGADREGWLCPALQKYYPEPVPERIYAQVAAISQS